MKEKMYRPLILVSSFILILLIFSPIVSAECAGRVFDRWDCGWKLIGKAVKVISVGSSQQCFNIQGGGNNFFVPTKTDYEWSAFFSRAPSLGISLQLCLEDIIDYAEKMGVPPLIIKEIPKYYSVADVDNALDNNQEAFIYYLTQKAITEERINAEYDMLTVFEKRFDEANGPYDYITYDHVIDNIDLIKSWKETYSPEAFATMLKNNNLEGYVSPDGTIGGGDCADYTLIRAAIVLSDQYNLMASLADQLDTYTILKDQYYERAIHPLDNNNDGICSINERCWGGGAMAGDDNGDGFCSNNEACCTINKMCGSNGDNDGDGLCEVGEGCCSADSEACNCVNNNADDCNGDGYYDSNPDCVLSYGSDCDNDGVKDHYVEESGYDPTTSDSDGDGYTDAEEIDAGSNPDSADEVPYYAYDDGGEDPVDTDPHSCDDGVCDANDPCSVSAAACLYDVGGEDPVEESDYDPTTSDSDGDGYTDAEEIAAGSNPDSADEVPWVDTGGDDGGDTGGDTGDGGW